MSPDIRLGQQSTVIDRREREHPKYANVGLMWSSANSMVEIDDTLMMSGLAIDSHPIILLRVRRPANGGYEMETFGRELKILDLTYSRTLSGVVSTAHRIGVSFIAPTVHGTKTAELARVAKELDIPYPSETTVSNVEDKERFYSILEEEGIPVPRTIVCDTEADIRQAETEFDGPKIVKLKDGVGSKFQKFLDRRRYSPSEIDSLIASHVSQRDEHGYQRSIVQEFVGDEEYGFEGLIHMTKLGPRLGWNMTTRKSMTDLTNILIDHVYDPADRKRLNVTGRLMIPTMQQVIDALYRRDPKGFGMPITPFNADIRVDKKKALPIDGSLRWMPHSQRMANVSVGRSCLDSFFPSLALHFALGEMFDQDMFTPIGPQRAVIYRRAFLEGGDVVQYQPVDNSVTDGIFYSDIHNPKSLVDQHLPTPGEIIKGAQPVGFPVVCAEGDDIIEAERNWNTAMSKTGLACINNGVISGYNANGRWQRKL